MLVSNTVSQTKQLVIESSHVQKQSGDFFYEYFVHKNRITKGFLINVGTVTVSIFLNISWRWVILILHLLLLSVAKLEIKAPVDEEVERFRWKKATYRKGNSQLWHTLGGFLKHSQSRIYYARNLKLLSDLTTYALISTNKRFYSSFYYQIQKMVFFWGHSSMLRQLALVIGWVIVRVSVAQKCFKQFISEYWMLQWR